MKYHCFLVSRTSLRTTQAIFRKFVEWWLGATKEAVRFR